MEIGLEIEIEVRDKNGKLIEKLNKKADSFVLNFIKALRGLVYGHMVNLSVTLIDTGGVARPYPRLYSEGRDLISVNAPADDANYGIWIGYGTTPVSPEDYTLNSKAPTTDFSYNTSTVEDVVYDSSGGTFRVVRTFTNISGATKTISEIALVFHEYDKTPADRYFMIARDILPETGVYVPDGGTITVRYVISVVF